MRKYIKNKSLCPLPFAGLYIEPSGNVKCCSISKKTLGNIHSQSIAELVALISFSLGIFNLIPFPPLDGGKLFLELITISRNGYPLPSTFTYRIQLIGVSILFGLIIFVTLSDIINIFNG